MTRLPSPGSTALSVVLAVVSTVMQLGRPPCLTPVQTGRWLVSNPAAASGADCHGRSKALQLRDIRLDEIGAGR